MGVHDSGQVTKIHDCMPGHGDSPVAGIADRGPVGRCRGNNEPAPARSSGLVGARRTSPRPRRHGRVLRPPLPSRRAGAWAWVDWQYRRPIGSWSASCDRTVRTGAGPRYHPCSARAARWRGKGGLAVMAACSGCCRRGCRLWSGSRRPGRGCRVGWPGAGPAGLWRDRCWEG
jgi:hypothetical protein